jgi:SAM-dependent methyltransferase
VVSLEQIAGSLEVVCGKPHLISHPVYKRITHRLDGLFEAVKARASQPGSPFKCAERPSTPPAQLEFIRAAAHFFPEETLRAANLVTVRPPDNIHRMQRSDPYWVGDFFSANMIIHALAQCGISGGSQSILDIGCSSGSLVRVLAAHEPGWVLHGRDPIQSAVEWASANVTTARFAAMDTKPPLDFADGSLDGVTAISVWSHHRADAARIWMEEVWRILKPGGWFAPTFSTLHHVQWLASKRRAPVLKILAMLDNITRTGNHFVPINYKEEESETDVDWGQSCFSREAFLGMFIEKFDILGYFPGLNQGNQDLAVFRKR